jgi:hypothetical protein
MCLLDKFVAVELGLEVIEDGSIIAAACKHKLNKECPESQRAVDHTRVLVSSGKF